LYSIPDSQKDKGNVTRSFSDNFKDGDNAILFERLLQESSFSMDAQESKSGSGLKKPFSEQSAIAEPKAIHPLQST